MNFNQMFNKNVIITQDGLAIAKPSWVIITFIH